MTLRIHTFDNQTDGLTVSQANSDDNGDPQLSAVSITGTIAPATMKYTTVHPVVGSGGVRIVGGVGDTCLMRSTAFTTAVAKVPIQIPFELENLPSSGFTFVNWRWSGGSSFSLLMDTAGKLSLSDAVGAAFLVGANPLVAGTDYILDAWPNVATATTGAFKYQVRKKSDLSVVQTGTKSDANLGTNLLNAVQIGKTNNSGAVTGINIGEFRYDDGGADYIPYSTTPLDFTLSASPLSGPVPFATTLTISNVTGGSGGTPTFTIDWGDGFVETTTSLTKQHTYGAAKPYTITVSGI